MTRQEINRRQVLRLLGAVGGSSTTAAQLSNSGVLTTRLYFDDKLSDEVHAAPPYSAHTGMGISA